MPTLPSPLALLSRLVRWTAVLIICLAPIAPVQAAPAPVQAASVLAQDTPNIQVISDTARQVPPQQVVFNLQVSGAAEIERVSIRYGYVGHGCDKEGTRWMLPVTAGKQVQTRWVLDFAKEGGFLPGVELWWQYEIHDRSGADFTSERKTLLLMDTAHTWKSLEEGQIHLYWYEGSAAFGERLLKISTDSLKRLAEDAGMKTDSQIRVLIYPDQQAMGEMLRYIHEWAGGVTYGEYDLIVIAIGPTDPAGWPKEVIPHELTHVITESGFVNCQAVRLPLWLVEGVAVYAEGPVTWEQQNLVKSRLAEDTLPELKTLRYSFPDSGEDAHLAYAQSGMVVTYMIETYGVDKMNRLVEGIRGGQTIDQALRTFYGLTTAELDETWRAGLGYGTAPEPQFITQTVEPSRTPMPTFELRASVGTLAPTATPLPTATRPPTATLAPSATVPATRTAIPGAAIPGAGQAALTPTVPAAAGPFQANLWYYLAGGVLLALVVIVSVVVWAVRRV